MGIVTSDRLVYAKGFGVGRASGAAVDTRTVFQIGSATKAFLSATLAIAVDRGKLGWDDQVIDRYEDFRLADPWVTREFRMFDLLAQRSGLPPYVNDAVGLLGLDRTALIRSLRQVAPVSSFRSTFTYTNVTHMLRDGSRRRRWRRRTGTRCCRDPRPAGDDLDLATAEAIEARQTDVGHRWAGGHDRGAVHPDLPL